MANNDFGFEKLLNEHELADFLAVSVACLRRWRRVQKGPRYMKIGAAVRYRIEDVSTWLESRPTGGASELNAQ